MSEFITTANWYKLLLRLHTNLNSVMHSKDSDLTAFEVHWAAGRWAVCARGCGEVGSVCYSRGRGEVSSVLGA